MSDKNGSPRRDIFDEFISGIDIPEGNSLGSLDDVSQNDLQFRILFKELRARVDEEAQATAVELSESYQEEDPWGEYLNEIQRLAVEVVEETLFQDTLRFLQHKEMDLSVLIQRLVRMSYFVFGNVLDELGEFDEPEDVDDEGFDDPPDPA
jgi:hypothetical protein